MRSLRVLLCSFLIMVVLVGSVSANPLARLFMGGASKPTTTTQSFERIIVGEWRIEKASEVQNKLPKIETFNVTILSTNTSIHYDLETEEAEGRAPGFKIRLDGAWSGTFLSANDLISGKPLGSGAETTATKTKPATKATGSSLDELPAENDLEFEDAKGPIDPASLVKIFDFTFHERENGVWISYGQWLDTRSYQFILINPNSWLLTIFDRSSENEKDIVVVEFTAKRIPKVDDLPWYKKISFSGMMLFGLLILNISKRFFLPKPPIPGPRATTPSSTSTPPAASAKSAKKKD